MKKKVVAMHFVCRDNEHVTDRPGGTFETRFWKVASKCVATVRVVALHQAKDSDSYRQGTVLDYWQETYNDRMRYVFLIRPTSTPLEWCGGGAGEKGYRYE